MTTGNDLQSLLNPKSITILGASSDFSKINGRALKYLLEKGYAGKIFPVNPKYQRIGPLPCFPTVAAIPEPADLAIVALPARLVAQAVHELGRRGVKSAVVFSSGFAETGTQGLLLEHDLIAAARTSGLRLCGPNCLGLINAFEHVMATFGQFAEGATPPGPVGFVTQSGAFGTAIAALARRRGLGLGYFVNTGNEGDIDFVEVMAAVLDDPRITVGAGYIEGLRDGEGLLALGEKALALGKPLVITKVGKTAAGARAAASHTGSLAGADEVFQGAIQGRGIVRARNEEHMLDIVEGFAHCALPRGSGLGIVTQSGGAGVLMADRAEELGLTVPVLSEATREALLKVIPGFGAAGNPVDVTGQFVAEPGLLREAVKIVLADRRVHIGIVWLQLMEAHVDSLIALFNEIRNEADKPFVVCWVAAPERALHALREIGIAVLRGAEPAVDAAGALVHYAAARSAWAADEQARSEIELPSLELPAAGGPVSLMVAQTLLAQCGVATAAGRLAATGEAAAAAADELHYPVALKIESPEILHKTEIEGVALALASEDDVRQAFTTIMANVARHKPQARIEGVVVQRMVRGDVELAIGLKKDPVFGVMVMAGLGGIHVEVLRDVVFRKAPVTLAEARQMLEQLRGKAILGGARGRPPVNRDRLAEFISAVSIFGAAAGPRLRECDLNPVLAGPDGIIAVDWLVMLDERDPGHRS